MALELHVEVGNREPNANSYASAEDFAAYAEAHLYADGYTAATDPKRAAALVMATRTIDAYFAFVGQTVDPRQPLAWPRTFSARPWDPWVPSSYVLGTEQAPATFEGELVPRRLRAATMELALALLVSNRTGDPDSAGIKKLALGQGALEVEFDPTTTPAAMPPTVVHMLSGLGSPRTATAGNRKIVRVQ